MSESENAGLGRNVRVTIMSPENVGAALMSRNHPRALRLHSPYFPSIWTVFLYKFPSSGFWTFCNCFVQPCGPTDLRNNLVGYLNVLGRRKTSKTSSHSRAGQSISEIHQKHPRKNIGYFRGNLWLCCRQGGKIN